MSEGRVRFACLALLGFVCAALMVMSMSSASGDELKLFAVDHQAELFAAPDPIVSLFEPPLELFGPQADPEPVTSSEPLKLFQISDAGTDGPRVKREQTAIGDFWRNQLAIAFAGNLLEKANNAVKPSVTIYLPDWYLPGWKMQEQVGKGDHRLAAKWVEGDERSYPAFIREYGAKHSWPVQHWTTPSGKGAMNSGNRSIDELVDLVKTEPGETPPVVQVKTSVSVVRH